MGMGMGLVCEAGLLWDGGGVGGYAEKDGRGKEARRMGWWRVVGGRS